MTNEEKTVLFLEQMKQLKESYNIKSISKKTTDIDKKRITKLVTDEYLKLSPNIHKAGFLEREIYEGLRDLNLSCDPIPDEIRIKQKKIKNFDPLRLVSRPDKAPNTKPSKLTKTILEILIKNDAKEVETSGLKTRIQAAENKPGATPKSKPARPQQLTFNFWIAHKEENKSMFED